MKTHLPRLLCLALILVPISILAADKPPNILFAFADDWGQYAGIYGEQNVGPGTINRVTKTPHFDRVAREGVLFNNAHVNAPSCTPCRSALMSGQYFYRTGQGAILQGAVWDDKIPTFPLLLEKAGYHIGHSHKVWSPGSVRNAPFGADRTAFNAGGRSFSSFSQTATRLIAQGKTVDEAKQKLLDSCATSFDDFLAKRNDGQPFLWFWGPTNVHRKWIKGSGKTLWGYEPDELQSRMPLFLPDVHEVRQDMADYLGEVTAFDAGLGLHLKKLEAMGELDNTFVIVSGDHGAPGFPRGKCNLYDFGTVKAGRRVDDFVNLMDIAPTLLELAGAEVPGVMTGRSLMKVLRSEAEGWVDPERSYVITGRERHVTYARAGRLPYPQRAIRTKDHLYIHNFRPDRYPMGDPGPVTADSAPDAATLENNTFICYGDLDASPTKAWMIVHRNDPAYQQHFAWGFGKAPREELYVTGNDPSQVENRIDDPELQNVVAGLRSRLFAELKRTGDPRVTGDGMAFERPPFTGESDWGKPPKPKGKRKK